MMLFDTPTFELAISRVLKRRGADEHEKFSLSQLVRDWHETGLRHADLNLILQSLIATQCVRRVVDGTVPLYQLTSNGMERLFSTDLPLNEMPTYERDVAVLAQVSARPRSVLPPHAARPHRRREDGPDRYGYWQSYA